MAENLSTLDLIHKAAKEEFLQKGFLKASLRNIVKNAGVTTGAFYGYYVSKEELFKSLVYTTYNTVLDFYKNALFEFENLPLEKQPQRMGKSGRECMEKMLYYFYGHKDEMHLILQCSKGTPYSGLAEEMIELEVKATRKYYTVLKKLGKDVPVIDKRLEHILVTGMMNAFFEMILHEMPLKKAVEYLHELNDFYVAGWLKIMGQ